MRVVTNIVLIICLLFSMIPNCEASISYGYDVYNIPESEADEMWDYFDITIVNEISMPNSTIINFDVSSEGFVAILTGDDTITVFDELYNVYRKFSFFNYGKAYIGWNNNNLLLFSVRDNIIAEFTLDGNCIAITQLSDHSMNKNVWKELERRQVINKNDCTYELSKDMGAILDFFSGYRYNTLIKTDLEGQKTIIFDINQSQKNKTTLLFFIVLGFVVSVITVFILGFARYNKGNRSEEILEDISVKEYLIRKLL